ncbi:hypothetical protein CAPTEDRAFT_191611 [Capitella teleta]|uniref:Uncharacterized protein n=1 Tax=Capitella teleta TaxID=283909 RepID=R7UUA8_CAPTE|nr:hypothetical protein CAPTEDRAFT_191611 [Capitella teleta]|eukprot:ELU09780.1 hypothetical protein CAPTEDRAFT_191611 [Capitella teleta]
MAEEIRGNDSQIYMEQHMLPDCVIFATASQSLIGLSQEARTFNGDRWKSEYCGDLHYLDIFAISEDFQLPTASNGSQAFHLMWTMHMLMPMSGFRAEGSAICSPSGRRYAPVDELILAAMAQYPAKWCSTEVDFDRVAQNNLRFQISSQRSFLFGQVHFLHAEKKFNRDSRFISRILQVKYIGDWMSPKKSNIGNNELWNVIDGRKPLDRAEQSWDLVSRQEKLSSCNQENCPHREIRDQCLGPGVNCCRWLPCKHDA